MTAVWVALGAAGDGPNEPSTEIIGVFSTEETALKAVEAKWPKTGEALRQEIDEIPDWAALDTGGT